MRALILALSILVLLPAACTHYEGPGDKLRRAVTDYNEGIRWQYWKLAAAHIRPEERAEFLARKEGQGSRMHVTDFEVRDVTHDSEKDEAFVIVDFTWHRYPSLTIHRTRVRQKWDYGSGQWFLDSQEEVKAEEEELTPDKMF